MIFMNGASTSKYFFVFHLNGSKHYTKYTFQAIHFLGTLDPGTSLVHITLKRLQIYCNKTSMATAVVCRTNLQIPYNKL